MKTLIALFIALSTTIAAMAQTQTEPAVYKSEFGVHAGFTTGLGLSYRYWPKKNGLQITMLPVSTGDMAFFSGGITWLSTFYESDKIRFFGFLGNHFLFTKDSYTNYIYDPILGNSYPEEVVDKDFMYNIGIGPGFGFGNRVRFNIMAGYAIYDVFDGFNLLPTGEVGLYYRF